MTNVFQMILGAVVIGIGFLAVFAYPKLQYTAIRTLRGGWRALSVLPLALMTVVVMVTVPAFLKGANLWPLFLIFAAPVASVYLAVLLMAHRYVARRQSRASQAES